jgi:small subunit ribosomal protein S16
MGVVLRLKRAGAKKRPFYRVVAADSRRQRDGRFIEILGHYDPMRSPAELVLEKDQIEKWLANGATPSEQVASLLRRGGMTWGRPSRPTKKKAEASGARKRAVKRTMSPRKAKKKVARRAPKAAAKSS